MEDRVISLEALAQALESMVLALISALDTGGDGQGPGASVVSTLEHEVRDLLDRSKLTRAAQLGSLIDNLRDYARHH